MSNFARIVVTIVVFTAGLAPLAQRPMTAPAGRSIPVFYDAALTASGFPSPLVRANIGNVEGLFIVDTGAGVHTLASWFVEATGLPTVESSATGHGSTGAKVPIRVGSNVRLTLSDATVLNLPEVAVADFPAIFKTHHLAGLLSPQLLASVGEAAVLDLRTPALSIEPVDLAQQLVSRPVVPPDDTRQCHNPQSIFTNRLYAAAAMLDGRRALMLVDSGATATIINRDAAVSSWFSTRSRPGASEQGLGGVVQDMQQVRDVQVERGGATVTLSIGVGSASDQCGPDGLLGMDALRGCSMVLGASTMAWSCAAAK